MILKNLSPTQQYVQNTWLLVAGVLSIAVIIAVLVLFSVFLVREVKEVRRQTSFIDSVTHELRSPLASLKLCLETLAREGLADDQRDQLREMMLDDVDRLSAFVDDILQASRIGHGEVPVEVRDIAVFDVIGECANVLTRRYKIPSDHIQIDVTDELRVITDPTALRVIIRNLLDNAIKYSDAPANVIVRARSHDPGAIVIEVIDRGVGIPPHALKRIFDRFYRVPDEAVHRRRGTGLGLFVVSALVRRLGGRLRAHSPGAGHGATFRVTLPAEKWAASAASPTSTTSTTSVGRRESPA